MDPVSSDYSEEGNSEKTFWNKKKKAYIYWNVFLILKIMVIVWKINAQSSRSSQKKYKNDKNTNGYTEFWKILMILNNERYALNELYIMNSVSLNLIKNRRRRQKIQRVLIVLNVSESFCWVQQIRRYDFKIP